MRLTNRDENVSLLSLMTRLKAHYSIRAMFLVKLLPHDYKSWKNPRDIQMHNPKKCL